MSRKQPPGRGRARWLRLGWDGSRGGHGGQGGLGWLCWWSPLRVHGGSRAAREEEQVWAKVLLHIHSGRWCAVETSGNCGVSYVGIAAGGLGWGQRELGREGTSLCPPRLPASPLPCYGTGPSVCLRVPGVSWKELHSSPCCSGCAGVFAVPRCAIASPRGTQSGTAAPFQP